MLTASKPQPLYHRAKTKLIFVLAGTLLLSSAVLFLSYYHSAFSLLSLLHTPFHYTPPERPLDYLLHASEHASRGPKTLHYHWQITAGIRAPDGVEKRVYLINDEFPGPVIEARSGDTLVVTVMNALQDGEGVSIHWHGIHLTANEMDGAIGFTQCAIPPGESFEYKFKIGDDEAGTFWYHSHSASQMGNGLFGGLIIHAPSEVLDPKVEYGYDEELLLMVGDWYQRPAAELLEKYLDYSSAGAEPVPDSMLINGMGDFDCSKLLWNSGLECKEVLKPHLSGEAGKKYRFRIINVGSMTGLRIAIPGSRITAVEVDGGNRIQVEDSFEEFGILYPGERINVIVEWGEYDQNHQPSILVALDKENFLRPNIALMPNQGFPVILSPSSKPHGKMSRPTIQTLSLSNISGLTLPTPLVQDPETQFVLYIDVSISNLHKNSPKGFMNRTTWLPQSSPPLPLLSLPRTSYDGNQLVPFVPSPSHVDLVINNMDHKGHPFYLHGSPFHILASCSQTWGPFYNPFTPTLTPPRCGLYNLIAPLRKDTVYIPGRGYVVLRFRADSKGIWAFHCHILWHGGAGMAMAFQVGGDEEGVFSAQIRGDAARFC